MIEASLDVVQIAIISDTHMPRGARALPDACVERLRAADLILHAGDIATLAVLDEFKRLGPVIAVHGNVDDASTRAALPASIIVQAGAHRIAMIHDAGPARNRIARLRQRFDEADAVVFGHSHIPLHERAPSGFQIFNPGSPTEKRRAAHHTMGIARVGAAGLVFELVELD